MPLDMPGAPAALNALCTFLESTGFRAIDVQSGGMGWRRLTFRRGGGEDETQPAAEVQLTADRGHWTVGVRFGSMNRFILPEAWEAYLDHAAMADPDADAQARFIQTRLAEAAAAVARDPDLEPELVRIGAEYMSRRYGITRESVRKSGFILSFDDPDSPRRDSPQLPPDVTKDNVPGSGGAGGRCPGSTFLADGAAPGERDVYRPGRP